MKYIRTKDGKIFDYAICEKIIINGTKWLFISKDGNYNLVPNQIIKQADTIEELCDEFVYFINGMPFVAHKGEKHYVAQGIPVVIFGAIWTDKGLIFVAKMNDKGELELL